MRIRLPDEIPPKARLTWGEARIVRDYVAGRRSESALAAAYPGDGRTVLLLPGMFSADRRMAMHKRVLIKAGYDAQGWELGRNFPHKLGDVMDRLEDRLSGFDRPTALVGWSLGGLIAREYAKRAPQAVSEVITMGSPFSGNPRHNKAWRAYEIAARHRIDASPFAATISEKPPVQTTAIWSAFDGIIPPRAARGLPHERDAAIEVRCGHLGYVCAPDAIEAVLKALSSSPRT